MRQIGRVAALEESVGLRRGVVRELAIATGCAVAWTYTE